MPLRGRPPLRGYKRHQKEFIFIMFENYKLVFLWSSCVEKKPARVSAIFSIGERKLFSVCAILRLWEINWSIAWGGLHLEVQSKLYCEDFCKFVKGLCSEILQDNIAVSRHKNLGRFGVFLRPHCCCSSSRLRFLRRMCSSRSKTPSLCCLYLLLGWHPSHTS